MPHVDKVMVTNLAVLRDKYRQRFAGVREALRGMIAADAARGLTTRLIGLDDARAMAGTRGRAVTDPLDPRQAKDAIDALCRHWRPDYVLILGAPDVVPHQDLSNPVYAPDDDDDRVVPSDLPYACEEPYGRDIARFRGPTRVVGRLPDLNGLADARYFSRVLRTAARHRRRPAGAYEACFGLTALPWRKSTALSLKQIFSADRVLHRSPPEGPAWRPAQLGPLTHFINCHGAPADTHFYGQREDGYPKAMRADLLPGKIREGAVIAAECCYGAQLHDPAITGGQMGICNAYLGEGAYAFFGSSTIAYGPSEGNGSADLITQFFVQRVLAGASTGRAVLEARLKFVLQSTHLDPTDLKTLGQFHLLGDPSVHVVGRATHALQRTRAYAKVFDGRAEAVSRGQRRQRLVRDGAMLGATSGAARPNAGLRVPPRVRRALEQAVRDSGLRPGRLFPFAVCDPAPRVLGRRRLRGTTPTAFYALTASRRARGGAGPRRVIVVATVQGGRIVRLRRLHAR